MLHMKTLNRRLVAAAGMAGRGVTDLPIRTVAVLQAFHASPAAQIAAPGRTVGVRTAVRPAGVVHALLAGPAVRVFPTVPAAAVIAQVGDAHVTVRTIRVGPTTGHAGPVHADLRQHALTVGFAA